MSDEELNKYLEFAQSLAVDAGEVMRKYFRSDSLQTSWKEGTSPVTIADTEINRMVIDRIKETYPPHGVFGEEESFENDRETIWVVDPVDGTAPFELGIPAATFCLALVHEGKVQVSVVYDPFQDQLFSAVRGRGTRVNGNPAQIPQSSDITHKYIFRPSVTSNNSEDFSFVEKEVRKQGAKIMAFSSFSYLASLILEGKMVAAFMSYGSPWDAAAISLIIQEAGGKATDLSGQERVYNDWADGILVSNGALHDKMVGLIKDARSRN